LEENFKMEEKKTRLKKSKKLPWLLLIVLNNIRHTCTMYTIHVTHNKCIVQNLHPQLKLSQQIHYPTQSLGK
jgi:hypothetical protein